MDNELTLLELMALPPTTLVRTVRQRGYSDGESMSYFHAECLRDDLIRTPLFDDEYIELFDGLKFPGCQGRHCGHCMHATDDLTLLELATLPDLAPVRLQLSGAFSAHSYRLHAACARTVLERNPMADGESLHFYADALGDKCGWCRIDFTALS